MNRKLFVNTGSMLATLPLLCAGCASTSRHNARHEPAPSFSIVNSPREDPIEPYQDLDLTRFGDTHTHATSAVTNVSYQTPQASRPARSTSLIGLYGEIASSGWEATESSDGGRNLSQISFASEGACFDPDVDRTGHRLVFASTRHSETSDLYIKSTNGKTITQITSDPADDLMPAFDPTGRQIAFASNRAGNWDIFITTPEGGRTVQLTNSAEPELHPTWSPDGSMISFCKFGSQSGRWEIWIVDVENPGAQSFLDYGLFPSWSPDIARNKILFQRARQRGSRHHSIWTIDIVGREGLYPTEIVSAVNAAVINPTWSPDGSRIAFVTVVDPDEEAGDTPEQSDVWIINLDGGHRTMLTSGQFANYQPVWSSTGSVFFVSNRSGIENIWAVGATDSTHRPDANESGIANVDPDHEGPTSQP